jgi:hypothetical protein
MNMLIRAAALAGYEELAASLGLDAAQQLRTVGLGPASLCDPDAMMSASPARLARIFRAP